MTTQTDRLNGLTGALGIKAPVRVATTANITLSGTQTIDGVAVVALDRVLVKDQTDPVENGIYDASATAWSRSPDFDGTRDVVTGTMIYVVSGTANAKTSWRIPTTGDLTPGTTSLTFEAAFGTPLIALDTHAATTKATPVDTDELPLVDSAASWVLKKLTFANLWVWIQSKLHLAVNVENYGADPTGVADSTAAFVSARAVSTKLRIGTGTFLLDNYRPVNGETWQTDGYVKTIIKQYANGNPAIKCLSDVTTGQLSGLSLTGFTLQGSSSPTVSALLIQATTPYVVKSSIFDYLASSTYRALEMVCTGANELYSNTITCYSTGSSSTAFITKGPFNTYDLQAVSCADGTALSDSSVHSTFERMVSDGSQTYAGQSNTINTPTVETIYGTAVSYVFAITGYDNVLIAPTVNNVSAAKVSVAAFGVFNRQTIFHPRIMGANYPVDPFVINSTGAGTIIVGGDCLCTNKIETANNAVMLAKISLLGDCSTYSIRSTIYPAPINKITATSAYTIDAYYVTKGLDTVVQNNQAASLTLTFPSDAGQIGRVISVNNAVAFTVISASSNVVPIGGSAGTAILAATVGKWADLQFDGTNWNIIANN